MTSARVAVVAALLLAACKGAFAPAGAGARADRIRFPHGLHREQGVECTTCHQTAYDSENLDKDADNLTPKESVCLDCHQDQKDGGNCVMCHTAVDRAADKPHKQFGLIFSHKNHVGEDRANGECGTCHESLPEIDQPAKKPAMETCFQCHPQSDMTVGKCAMCHTDLKRYPLKPLADFSHEGGWLERHPGLARSAPQNCATCHEKTYCATCHTAATAPLLPERLMPEKPGREFIHRADFVSRHMIEQAADPASCRRCHGTGFCEDCHRRQSRTPDAANPRDPHPKGWAFPGSAQFHGTAARQDISSCSVCHDQGAASNCVTCHKSGGIGGNPHPKSWIGHHDRKEIAGNGMCLFCHP